MITATTTTATITITTYHNHKSHPNNHDNNHHNNHSRQRQTNSSKATNIQSEGQQQPGPQPQTQPQPQPLSELQPQLLPQSHPKHTKTTITITNMANKDTPKNWDVTYLYLMFLYKTVYRFSGTRWLRQVLRVSVSYHGSMGPLMAKARTGIARLSKLPVLCKVWQS